MKVLLAIPSQQEVYGEINAPKQMNMALAYIGAVLQQNGHKVDIMDIDSEDLNKDKLAERIVGSHIDVAGITVTTPTLYSALELARTIKSISPSTIIVFGGIHPSVEPLETIKNNEVDFVVKGEGEITFLEFLAEIKNKGDFSKVDGLVFKKGCHITQNKDRKLIKNLDSLPFPARSLFKNASYTYPDSLHSNTAPIITSRGCPGRCTYCNAQSIFGRVFRARSAENVVDEIEQLIKNSHTQEIHIWDDNFVTDKKRVFSIRDEIKKRNIRVKFAFPNGLRADFLCEETIKALKEMGTYSIAIGVESGSVEVLTRANKGIRLEVVENAFKLAKRYGLETWAFFMFGLPGEDLNAAHSTINFAKKIDPDVAKFHILKPFPGTPVYEYMRENNLLIDLNYRNYGIHTPPVHNLEKLSGKELLEIQKMAYRKFYFRPKMLLRQLLRLKSLNRLKLNFKAAIDVAKMAFVK